MKQNKISITGITFYWQETSTLQAIRVKLGALDFDISVQVLPIGIESVVRLQQPDD